MAKKRRKRAEKGSFTLTGQDVPLTRARVISAEPGSWQYVDKQREPIRPRHRFLSQVGSYSSLPPVIIEGGVRYVAEDPKAPPPLIVQNGEIVPIGRFNYFAGAYAEEGVGMSDNVIELKQAETEKPANTCFCCEAPVHLTDFTVYTTCSCEQKIYGRCQLCRYCLKHCQCNDEMKALRAELWRNYQKGLDRIRFRFAVNVNQREG